MNIYGVMVVGVTDIARKARENRRRRFGRWPREVIMTTAYGQKGRCEIGAGRRKSAEKSKAKEDREGSYLEPYEVDGGYLETYKVDGGYLEAYAVDEQIRLGARRGGG